MAILEVYNVKGKTIEKRKVTEQEKKAIKGEFNYVFRRSGMDPVFYGL